MSGAIKMHAAGVRRYDPDILAAEISKLLGLDLTPDMILEDGVRFESAGETTGFLEITLMKPVKSDDWRRILNAARINEGVA
jgi:hypothetical protein